MASEIWYPILADVLALHGRMMEGLGENAAPFKAGGREAIESALAVPQWAALHGKADLAEQAALLAIRIAQAHALVDQNKRLAYIVAVVFLRQNKAPLPAEYAMGFAQQIVGALEHTVTTTEVAGWLRDVITS